MFPRFFSQKKEPIKAAAKAPNPLLQDSDSDGLQNWEEELYKTDPINQDSDGDGISDGEEIKLGRNPALPGPDDQLTGPSLEETPKNTNLTQLIFEEFMRNGGAATLLNQGRSGNPEAVVAQKVESFLETSFIPAKTINKLEKADGLKLAENQNAAAVEKYLNEVGIIADKYSASLPEEDDLDLFLEIADSQNNERFKEFAPYRELAEKTAKELRELSVPADLAGLHGTMVWIMEESARQLTVLEKTGQDPAAALAVVSARIDLKIQAAKFYEELRQEIEGSG